MVADDIAGKNQPGSLEQLREASNHSLLSTIQESVSIFSPKSEPDRTHLLVAPLHTLVTCWNHMMGLICSLKPHRTRRQEVGHWLT